MAFIKFIYDCQYQEKNNREELIQRVAWRLVRSAADKMGDQKGVEKRVWAIEQIKKEFDGLGDEAEHYIRAAYRNYKIESGN